MGNLEMVKQRLMLEMWNMNLVRKSLVDLIDIATTGSTGDMFRDEFHTVLGYMKNLSPLTDSEMECHRFYRWYVSRWVPHVSRVDQKFVAVDWQWDGVVKSFRKDGVAPIGSIGCMFRDEFHKSRKNKASAM